MQDKPIGRRQLLQRAALLVGATGAAYRAAAAAPAVCEPADDVNSSLRRSLNYTEASTNPAQRCSGCNFFSAPEKSCGMCAIFGGPANINGHCDSWASKA